MQTSTMLLTIFALIVGSKQTIWLDKPWRHRGPRT